MLSPQVSTGLWEVWVYARPDYMEPVRSCGSFREERGAVHAASLLQDYLHLGAWNDNLLDGATEADAEFDLRVLPADLRALGIDPARTHVTARRREEFASDNSESAVEPDHLAWLFGVRRDAGHGAAGPHGAGSVRAKRAE